MIFKKFQLKLNMYQKNDPFFDAVKYKKNAPVFGVFFYKNMTDGLYKRSAEHQPFVFEQVVFVALNFELRSFSQILFKNFAVIAAFF